MDARAGGPGRAEGRPACRRRDRRSGARRTTSRSRSPSVSLACAVEQKPEYRDAAKRWTLAAIDYEPWGYTYNKPNVDLAAGHCSTRSAGRTTCCTTSSPPRSARASARRSSGTRAWSTTTSRPAAAGKRRQLHPEPRLHPDRGARGGGARAHGRVDDAPSWAALARAHHHRAGQLLSPDGYYYEGIEYWIFPRPGSCTSSTPGSTRPARASGSRDVPQLEALPRARAAAGRPERLRLRRHLGRAAHARAAGADYARVYPGGTLQSNFNVMYRVAARLRDPEAQAVAERYASFGHSNLEEYWTLLWRDPELEPAPMARSRCGIISRIRRRLLAHVVGERRDGVRVQGGSAGGPSRRAAAAAGSRVAVEQRPRASRRGQLHHVGTRPLPDGRHRILRAWCRRASTTRSRWAASGRASRASTTCGGHALRHARARRASLSVVPSPFVVTGDATRLIPRQPT